MTAMALDVRELTVEETGYVTGSVGPPGAVIGFVGGAVISGGTYIAGHAGGTGGGDASFGGALTAIWGGGLAGAVAGFSGGWIPYLLAGLIGIGSGYFSSKFDNGGIQFSFSFGG